jgi:hypothetical protein
MSTCLWRSEKFSVTIFLSVFQYIWHVPFLLSHDYRFGLLMLFQMSCIICSYFIIFNLYYCLKMLIHLPCLLYLVLSSPWSTLLVRLSSKVFILNLCLSFPKFHFDFFQNFCLCFLFHILHFLPYFIKLFIAVFFELILVFFHVLIDSIGHY